MLITKLSPYSGKENTRDIPVTDEQIINWKENGYLIQEAMPNVSADDREFLMTGLLPEEWDKLYGEEN